ncbi:MAG: hypothetical protein IT580_23455 [Verrucomicrobiales bacterium]|nr:hypothetical protein [Verrucomicrobiales bacterium]
MCVVPVQAQSRSTHYELVSQSLDGGGGQVWSSSYVNAGALTPVADVEDESVPGPTSYRRVGGFLGRLNGAPVVNSRRVTVASSGRLEILLEATDPDGTVVSFRVVEPPVHGTLTGVPPNVIYQPASGFSGADRFAVVASDGELESVPGVIEIEVKPFAPSPLKLGVTFSTEGLVLQGTGAEGAYSIEASADLVHWVFVARVESSGGTLHWLDSGTPSARYQFYRVRPAGEIAASFRVQVSRTLTGIELTAAVEPGTYRVEVSTDLTAWTSLATTTVGATGFRLVPESVPGQRVQFYRLVREP